jgi:transcriptional regulator with XRE-family HTH domain
VLQVLREASTGILELDRALDGLYWGDNVVWEAREEAALLPFFRAIAARAQDYDAAVYVTLARSPDEVRTRYPSLSVLDARADSPLSQPGPLLRAILDTCRQGTRALLLFDPLPAMVARWGAETARLFFLRTCPALLELGAVAYRSVCGDRRQALYRDVEATTQCVLSVEDGRLRIVKAEGRRPGVEGSVLRYQIEDGAPLVSPAPAAARVGAALRALRLQRGLSKSDLARLAGVSPSAVSQAERGLRGLSLDTLLRLSAELHITLDELLRGDVASDYRLGRRHSPDERSGGQPLPLLDDPQVGLRAYLVQLPGRGSLSLRSGHKGLELVAVAAGLVQVTVAAGRPVLRRGEVLLAERSGIAACRNLTDQPALLFWILRDDPAPARRADSA